MKIGPSDDGVPGPLKVEAPRQNLLRCLWFLLASAHNSSTVRRSCMAIKTTFFRVHFHCASAAAPRNAVAASRAVPVAEASLQSLGHPGRLLLWLPTARPRPSTSSSLQLSTSHWRVPVAFAAGIATTGGHLQRSQSWKVGIFHHFKLLFVPVVFRRFKFSSFVSNNYLLLFFACCCFCCLRCYFFSLISIGILFHLIGGKGLV